MREKRFVEQNQKNWIKFEKASQNNSTVSPEEFNDLFSQITEDLSYSRTHYQKRSIRVYLNALAQKIYIKLHQRRGSAFQKLFEFWAHDLPLALYQAKRELNISLIFFLVSMAIGVLSSIHEPDFATIILGDQYIAMTEENIANGDPMGVYKSAGEFEMFFQITVNNILVAFRTFVLGAFFGVGTLIIMLYNGIMVGTFQYFFIERELFQESFLTIWMHGALEISSIVIAGAAGLTMGRGLLFPGTLPRKQAFILGARRAIKIMVGLVPIFITAGFIEGFFTRLTEMPDFLRGTFIFACFIFIGTYFWLYPWMKFKGKSKQDLDRDDLILDDQRIPTLKGLRKTTEIFNSTFILFRMGLFRFIGISALGGILFSLILFLIFRSEIVEFITFSTSNPFSLFQFHDYGSLPVAFFLNAGLETLITLFCFYYLSKSYSHLKINLGWRAVLKVLVIVTIFELSFLADTVIVSLLGLIALPFLVFWLVVSLIEELSLPNAFGSMLALLNGTKRYIFLTYLSFAALSFLILVLLSSPFTWFYVDVLQWNVDAEYETKETIAIICLTIIDHFGLALMIPLILVSQFFEYFSAREAKYATSLVERVKSIGVKRVAYGMEQE
ncbi:MAG: stage II sporulation protein M [Bacteroidota bacterium]